MHRHPPTIRELVRHADTGPVRPIDVGVAVGLAALSLVPFASGARDLGPRDGLTVGLLLLESLPLVVRRRYPLEIFLVVVTASIVHIALIPQGQALSAGLGILVAMYTIGERLDRSVSLPLATLAGAVVGVLLLGRGTFPDSLQSVVQTEAILGVAWVVGDATRIRRLFTESLEERTRLLDRERDERSRRAVLEERQRIARELHDVVGHHMSVIVVQSGGALSALDHRPDEARAALGAIATAGRQGLTEMRRLVDILGSDESAGPMPGLRQLDALLAQSRAAGLRVDLSVIGEPRDLDGGLELSAYRIVQEALTNSLKHGGGQTSTTIRYASDALEIIVEDHGARTATSGIEPLHGGRGLLGMRERVAMLRGTLDAGHTPDGFRIIARLPFPAESAS
jgi:signal transduction histidine kinase